MVSVVNNVVDQTWEQVSRWPQDWQKSLAQRLLHSISVSALGSPTPSGNPAELIGAWKVLNPPSDAEIGQILDEERQRKHFAARHSQTN